MEKEVLSAKANSAALAFHKALIGLSQLDALERLSGSTSSLYGPRGIYTYYVVYHLFCGCMLIAPEEYADNLKAPSQYGVVTDAEINSASETPLQWDNGRDYEADWATKISHSQVKRFCAKLRSCNQRQLENSAPYLIPLFQYFIDDENSETQCIPGLYEKLCYVRDRVIYRPSYVIPASGWPMQTSAQTGQELRSLPNAETLYQAFSQIYATLLICMERELEEHNLDICSYTLIGMWVSPVDEGDLDGLCALGHSKEDLEKLGQSEGEDRYSFPSYLSHLLEMESMDFVLTYIEKYWAPLKKQYDESQERRRARNNSSN